MHSLNENFVNDITTVMCLIIDGQWLLNKKVYTACFPIVQSFKIVATYSNDYAIDRICLVSIACAVVEHPRIGCFSEKYAVVGQYLCGHFTLE